MSSECKLEPFDLLFWRVSRFLLAETASPAARISRPRCPRHGPSHTLWPTRTVRRAPPQRRVESSHVKPRPTVSLDSQGRQLSQSTVAFQRGMSQQSNFPAEHQGLRYEALSGSSVYWRPLIPHSPAPRSLPVWGISQQDMHRGFWPGSHDMGYASKTRLDTQNPTPWT